jgi:uncharacterized protein YPO0396
MSKQPEALRLAEWLQAAVQMHPQISEDEPGGYCAEVDQVIDEAAAELRRLHAANAELVEVLSDLLAEGEFTDYPGTRQADAVNTARAALSKHKEQGGRGE